MHRLLKKFCVWLIAVALLGQGIAAMASASCGSKPVRPAVGHVLADDLYTQHSELSTQPMSDQHPGAMPAFGSKCSKCVAGCIAAALPTADAGRQPNDLVVRGDSAPAHSSYADYLPATPERPPRRGLS